MGNVRVYIGEIGNLKFWLESLKGRHKLGYLTRRLADNITVDLK